MKQNHLITKISIALIFGFVVAGGFTSISYPCKSSDMPAGESAANCVAFEHAIIHPGDLFKNEQGSLVRYVATTAVVSLTVFAALSLVSLVLQRKSKQ